MKSAVFLVLLTALLLAPTWAISAEPDLRSPRQVLPGHWKDMAGKLHYYISTTQITMIDGGAPIGTYSYEVVEENRPELSITLKLNAGDARLRTVRVDFKRKGFMETFQYKGVTINNIMLYVDDQQAP